MASPTTVLAIEHIVQTPGICGGKPRIAGRRVKVSEIVLWHRESHLSAEKIAAQFELTLAEVYAALSYYFDHAQEIDQQIQDERAFETTARPADDPGTSGTQ
jgi:uncharacterized protein (DUF433 family)